MKSITITTPCYNEEENVRELYSEIKAVMAALPQYDYEHVFVDNASSDGTLEILKELAAKDRRVKVIVNIRNFGHIRSPYHGLLQSRGDAVILMASDLQDPPALIPEYLKKWEEGWKVVLAQKTASDEPSLFYFLRKAYYKLATRLADVELLQNVTGTGLYDQEVIREFRKLGEAYPYIRGLVAELGYPVGLVEFRQPTRKRGITKNNFLTLYDMAMLGITSHSKVPLRLATMCGFAMSVVSFLIALGYLMAKLLFWYRFEFGLAPLIIGIFFLGSVQLFFIGILGEYIGWIHTRLQNRPHVIERERINFAEGSATPAASGGLKII